MSEISVFYRLEVNTRAPDTIFGDSTVSTFNSLEAAQKTACLFKEKFKLSAPIKIFKITYQEVNYEKNNS